MVVICDGTLPTFCTMPFAMPMPSKSPDAVALFKLYIHGYIINIIETIPISYTVFIRITFFGSHFLNI